MKHTPCTLRIRILQHLEEDDIVLLEDEGISILLDAKDKIDSLRNNDEEETDSSSCAERETSTEGQQKVALGIAPERSEKNHGNRIRMCQNRQKNAKYICFRRKCYTNTSSV